MNRYVQKGQGNFVLLALTSLLVFAIALLTSACEPGGFPVIENQRSQYVNISVSHVREDGTLDKPVDYGVVPARTTKELAGIVFVKYELMFRIEAVAPSGKVVFSHDYNWNDLEKISWKIIIPP